MSEYAKNLTLLHFTVIIFGFTGVLGKLITLNADHLVWYRMAIATIGLLIYAVFARKPLAIDVKGFLKLGGTGIIVAAHWITFFLSIKESNISVALATISTTSLFVALLEPIVANKKIKGYELILGGVVILGLLIIFGAVDPKYYVGIFLSLVSAALAALFASFNGVLINHYEATKISFYELGFGMLVLFGFLAFKGEINSAFFDVGAMDWLWLLILGLICTSFAFVASVEVVKSLSVFTVSLSINLEPIYSIILALLLFNKSEKMTAGFYIGALLIVFTLFANAWFKKRERKAIEA